MIGLPPEAFVIGPSRVASWGKGDALGGREARTIPKLQCEDLEGDASATMAEQP